jgi:general secretion pathway protein B
MSFILDALKKSETERQEQSAAEFSSVPASSGGANPLRWLWLLAALLLVNVAVLVGILMQPGDDPASRATTTRADDVAASEVAPPAVAETTTQSFKDRVANAVNERPPVARVSQSSPPEPPATTARPETSNAPTLDQLRLDGSLNLPELNLDIHVYSDDPAERFVFINMHKHREGARIEAGPEIREIRPDGVILEYQGQTFLLPRQ